MYRLSPNSLQQCLPGNHNPSSLLQNRPVPAFLFLPSTLFFLTGIVRIVVTAILLKLIDKMMGSFTIAGFWPALVIAITVAIVGAIVDGALAPSEAVVEERQREAVLLTPGAELAFNFKR
ncbi:MAG: hypothetical protein EOP49_49810 [Sphingobacteriales bacterium]|nr:MAG: hypothetical protein EOP49_49810 [Sphingobacteriales bacterium]